MKGYRKLPGSSRRYENISTGETISRYEYDSLRLRKLGWANRYQAEKYRSSQQWKRIRHSIKTRNPNATKLTMFDKPMIASREVYAYRKRNLDLPDNKLHAGGPLATFLETLGVREEGAIYDVGDTPSQRK